MGFFTFLVALPLGLLFILFTSCYATNPTLRSGILLFLAEPLLFFWHGLVFAFANAVGAALLLVKYAGFRRLLLSLAPYTAAVLVVGLYAFIRLPGW